MLHSVVMGRFSIRWLVCLGWFYSLSASALTPPIGWVLVSPQQAVLDASNMEKGTIYEFRIPNGNGKPEELVAALLEQDLVSSPMVTSTWWVQRDSVARGCIGSRKRRFGGRFLLHWSMHRNWIQMRCFSLCLRHLWVWIGARKKCWVPAKTAPHGVKSTH